VYRKLARVEPTTGTEWVRDSARESRAVMDALAYTRPEPFPGDRVKRLDGHALAATEHRLKALRRRRAAALPGNAVGVYEPARHLRVDLFPCEDGHAQERSLLPALVETLQRGEVGVGDRHFCVTDLLVGMAQRGAYFIVREHEHVRLTPQEAMRDCGRVETGTVAAQRGVLTRAGQPTLAVRRIAVRLDPPTRAGDTPRYLLTDLPPADAPATGVARVYRGRWRLETAFQILATALTSEIDTLAYPKAALFGFAVAGVTDNVRATATAALAQGQGADTIERALSDHDLAAELDAVAAGMAEALPAQDWQVFRLLPLTAFVACLLTLAEHVRWARFRKHPRGPKKPPPKRSYDPKHPHVSTARLIAARK